MTIARVLEPRLRRAARQAPVVAVTGPRQSGKTTVCRSCFPGHDYVSLEPLDAREFAETDPRGFLAQHRGPVVLDEVQRVPGLFSYLHEAVDDDPEPGRFVLTGSQHFGLTEAISQSLAGRVAMLHLLPLSLEETRRFPAQTGGQRLADLWTTVWTGGYPRIHDRRLPPADWLNDYADTYVQRDMRQALQVTNLAAFSTFLRLAAGRTAQELNLSALGADAGVAHPTVRAWLSVLEASFVVFRVPPWLRNFRKRLVKAPKLHFVDSGLACRLLGIRHPGPAPRASSARPALRDMVRVRSPQGARPPRRNRRPPPPSRSPWPGTRLGGRRGAARDRHGGEVGRDRGDGLLPGAGDLPGTGAEGQSAPGAHGTARLRRRRATPRAQRRRSRAVERDTRSSVDVAGRGVAYGRRPLSQARRRVEHGMVADSSGSWRHSEPGGRA